MTERHIIATGEIVSAEYQSVPPNGCLPPIAERRIQYVTIFEADYYGNGPHRYAEGHSRIQITGSYPGPAFDFWQDGHPERVAKWEARIN